MRTINTLFNGISDLNVFITENDIVNSKNILLQIFTGLNDKQFIERLIYDIKTILPDIKIIGSTTDGEILDNTTSSNSTVLSFCIFENTIVKTYGVKQYKSSYQTSKYLIKSIENIQDSKVAITFADGLNTNGEVFLKAFSKYAPHLTIAGGLAGDNATFTHTYVFTEDGCQEFSTVTAVLYNNDLIVNTQFSFGWEEIGKEFTITKSRENRVYKINDKTPVEIYKKYLGEEIEEQLPATGIEFPLIVNRNGNKIARAVLGKHDDGSLTFAGNLKQGDKVHLGYGNVENILNSRVTLYNNISSLPIEGIFIYSCMARKRLMGDAINNEIAPLSEISSVSGFFTYGEFFNHHINSKCNLLNQTMTILILSENPSKNDNNNLPIIDEKNIRNAQTIKALSKLVSETTTELKTEIDKNLQKDMQLLEQAKMVAMGEMLGNIAHHWRQPLSVISSAAGSMILEKELNILTDESLERNSNAIIQNAQYLSKTIDTFRGFLTEEKENTEVNLQDRIDESLNILSATLKNNFINIINEIDYSTLISIVLPLGELSQVIINIINNAKDILIQKNSDQNRWIKITCKKIDNISLITIEDNGGGIPDDIITKIFEPYTTTKHKSQGTGLGLHMSYKIITENLKGKLYAKNTTNGAKFFIELPITN